MNDLEDRLKDAYASAASTVSPASIRQLDEQSVVITWPTAKPPRSARRWAVPLTAAAVLAVTAAAALPTILSTAGGNVALNPLGERFVGALTPDSQKFAILSSAAGVKVATVTPPGPGATFRAAATGDGVTYVVATANGGCQSTIYHFKLNSAGQPSRLALLGRVGYVAQNVSQLAISGDGHLVAYLASRCTPEQGQSPLDITVVNLTNGQRAHWSLPRRTAVSPLSLSGDGHWLTFGADGIDGVHSAIYLLNTASAGGPIGRSQVLVSSAKFNPSDELEDPQISLNGRVVYFTTLSGSVASPAEQIRSVSTETGHLRLIKKTTEFFINLVADPAGHRAIATFGADLMDPFAEMFNLKTGKFTKLSPSFFVPGDGEYIW
jgi:hypothetical protein